MVRSNGLNISCQDWRPCQLDGELSAPMALACGATPAFLGSKGHALLAQGAALSVSLNLIATSAIATTTRQHAKYTIQQVFSVQRGRMEVKGTVY